jgi:hypothetical protein
VKRAVHLAEGHAALRAAPGLLFGPRLAELAVDLAEVMAALARIALFRRAPFSVNETKHFLGHANTGSLQRQLGPK